MTTELTLSQRRAIKTIRPWLDIENFARPLNPANFHPNNSYSTASSIYNKLPKDWAAIQGERDALQGEKGRDAIQHTQLRIGRNALKLCEQARRAYIYQRVASKIMHFEEIEKRSWAGLDKYVSQVIKLETALPKEELLKLPLEDAINTYTSGENYRYNSDHTYIGLVGLTALVLSEHTKSDSYDPPLIIPQPGLPDDKLVVWDFKPQ